MFDVVRIENDKMRNDDRILKLQPFPGKKPLDTYGIVDPRLFTGESKVHATMDPQTTLWSIRFSQGAVPPVFHQKFTSFKQLKQFADTYFKKRNMEIVEVLD